MIWPALRFQRDEINRLRNVQDSNLKQIQDAFKDPEDGFWNKNSSEDITLPSRPRHPRNLLPSSE